MPSAVIQLVPTHANAMLGTLVMVMIVTSMNAIMGAILVMPMHNA